MVTFLYAGILGLLYVALSFYTIAGRFKHRVILGDGGNHNMLQRIRVHANFAEYVPFILILMALYENMYAVNFMLLHIAGIMLVLGRIIYSLNMLELIKIPAGRQTGMVLTVLSLLILSIMGIYCYLI